MLVDEMDENDKDGESKGKGTATKLRKELLRMQGSLGIHRTGKTVKATPASSQKQAPTAATDGDAAAADADVP